MLRLFGLLFGLPVLLIGTICIGVALSGVIGNALNKDPNSHAIGAFPVFALYGLPFVWPRLPACLHKTRQAIHAQV
jgi:hypothetical protein